MKPNQLLTGVAVLLATPGLAMAHPGHAGHTGFEGVAHVLAGVDHLLMLVAIGMLAAYWGGRSLVVLPLGFLGACLVGGAISASGLRIPLAETLIACSVLVGGVMMLKATPASTFAVAALAMLGLFHGYTHALEAGVNAGAYFGGLAMASVATIVGSMLLVVAIKRFGMLGSAQGVLRLAGAALSVVAVGMLVL